MTSNQDTSPSSSSSSSSSSAMMTHLSQDQIFSILHLLPVESILSFSMTCKKFRSLASSGSLWELICRRDWGPTSVDGFLSSLSPQERRMVSWKKLYKEISEVGSLSCRRLVIKDGIFPTPRASHSLNFVSDCLVLFGGGCEGGRHLDDTWVAYVGGNQYRSILNWKKVNSGTPSGRFGQTCTVVGNTLILFGGINDNGIRQNDTWVGNITYDSTPEISISWQLLENVGPMAPPPRGAHAACLTRDHRMVVISQRLVGVRFRRR
ncbi:uncharacterized protein A4U43_C05F35300 [Asparagus officinalis]|uniref:F-box domain-containing protein n=1 Tax=Asparagus officinalis TaxID=4686 RepID=A0A5P1F2E0_ASPOF|nr:uncharacterized protein A4U43_C05F35300 [Asparagus officinalis]